MDSKCFGRIQPTSPERKRKPQDFEFGKVIGEGSYAVVKLAKEKKTGNQFAVKILDKRHILKENKQKYVNIEKQVFTTLNNHPFFVQLYYTFQDASKLYFVLSYASRGELLSFLKRFSSFDVKCTRFYSAEIIEALEFMHSFDIIHRDLKPENILLTQEMHVNLTDFGTAKILPPQNSPPALSNTREKLRANSFVGTAEYVSPELLSDKTASKNSDLWALGCILYQMLSGKPPFQGANEYQTFQAILQLDFTFPDFFPADARDLIAKLLVRNPQQRIGAELTGGFSALKAHPFFEGVAWGKLSSMAPPKICAYLPAFLEAEAGFYGDFDDSEFPSFDDSFFEDFHQKSPQILPQIPILNLSKLEKIAALDRQSLESRWRGYVAGNELILKSGFVFRRTGFFKKQMGFLFTDFQHILLIDYENQLVKFEIPLFRSTKEKKILPNLKFELKSESIFFLYTPENVFYLEDAEKKASEWISFIQKFLDFPSKT